MPLYVFECPSCSREFEELCKSAEDKKQCPDCGKDSVRKEVNSFGVSTKLDARRDTIYSNKEIDKVVGAASDKQWQGYDDRWNKIYKERREKRRAGKEIKEVVINPGSGGKVVPFENLGSKSEQKFRQNYSSEYKKQIVEKGKNGDNTPVIMKRPN